MILTILLCLAGTAPADCRPATALDVVTRPATAIECAMPWQAATEQAAARNRGLALVIRCARHSPPAGRSPSAGEGPSGH